MAWLKNFVPKTGVGRCDAYLLADELYVRLKLHVVTALSRDEQTTWTSKFEPLIKQYWEGKYGFGKNGTTVKPLFFIEYTDEPRDAHFVINISPGEGGFESVSRDTYWKLKDETGFLPASASFARGTVNPTDSSAMAMTGLRESFPFYVDTAGGAISSHSREQLHMLARELKRADPTARVQVTGYGAQKTVTRALVKRLLEQWGLTNVHNRSSKRFFSTSRNPNSAQRDYVKVSLSNGLGMIDASSLPLFSYPAAAVHEFGHMIGLQDEYMCMSKSCSDKLAELDFVDASEQAFYEGYHVSGGSPPSDRPGAGQVEFVIYCRDAGVAPPHFGMHTISIMSSGSKFLPCHFVTIWAALEKITQAVPGKYSVVKLD